MTGYCPRCYKQISIEPEVAGKIACGLLGLGAGAQTKNPVAALVCLALGVLIGHAVDTYVAPRCPLCGTVLRLLAARI